MAAQEWEPLAHAFARHKVKSEDDVRKHWPKGLDANHLKMGADGNALVKRTPELRAADARLIAQQIAAKAAATQAPKGGYVVPSTMTGGSDTAYKTPEQANAGAMEAMQANPMAYMRYAAMKPGEGFKMAAPVMQFEPEVVTAAKPKAHAAQKPKDAPQTAQAVAKAADPIASAKGRALFDAILQGGKQAVKASTEAAKPVAEVMEVAPAKARGAAEVATISPGDETLRQASKAANIGDKPKFDKADLVKMAHQALKMHAALAEDEAEDK